jgi:hypothetical protein
MALSLRPLARFVRWITLARGLSIRTEGRRKALFVSNATTEQSKVVYALYVPRNQITAGALR